MMLPNNAMNVPSLHNDISRLIDRTLKPIVKKIDAEAYYPLPYLQSLGRDGFLYSQHLSQQKLLARDVHLIEETSKTCMTTGFNLWCHFTALTYLRNSENAFLRQNIIPLLENGTMCGGTGLSNPMKFYGGLEKLCLKAERTTGGYIISGQLPSVSNLGPNSGFAVVAALNDQQQVMAFVPGDAKGLSLKGKTGFLGLDGSATYTCKFSDVFIGDDWIIAEDADEFIKRIRTTFLLYQIPLGLGVITASIDTIHRARNRQYGCNEYLPVQPAQLEEQLHQLREQTYHLAAASNIHERWLDALQVRLDTTNLTMQAVHTCMLHCGGIAYLQNSDPARRLRESYFLVHLTPTLKHLGKLLAGSSD